MIGGNFIMPYLDIAIKPQEGTLLHFQILDNDGLGIVKSLHAGCPILAGEKLSNNTKSSTYLNPNVSVYQSWITAYDQKFQCSNE